MQYKRITALALAVSMLAPMITSCAKSNTKNIVVKEDDPWYESVRFDLETDKLPSEMIDSSVVTYENDRLYHLYSLTNLSDYDNYRRTMLDTYDSNGNLLNQIKVTDLGKYSITRINSIKPGKDGNTAEAIAELFGASGFETKIPARSEKQTTVISNYRKVIHHGPELQMFIQPEITTFLSSTHPAIPPVRQYIYIRL